MSALHTFEFIPAERITTQEKAVALRYIVHLVGDITQPFHASLKA